MSSSQRAGARRRPRRGLRVSQPAPVFFFFNDTPTTEIYTAQYTLSLHDALPIRVAIPKFPSEPTNSPTRSGPHGSPPGLPSSTTRPSPSTTSSASTCCAVTPYLRQCGPPAFSATLPPTVHAVWLEGSGA